MRRLTSAARSGPHSNEPLVDGFGSTGHRSARGRPPTTRLECRGSCRNRFLSCLYFARRLHDGETASALWACHLASLLVGAGILLRRAGFVAIGVLWLLVGIPMWFVYLSIGGPFRPASALTHLGGLAVGCLGLAAFGMPRQMWWKAMAGLLILLGVSRWVSPPALNVNLSFHVYQSRDPFPGFYAAAIVGLTIGTTLFLFLAEQALRRIFPSPGRWIRA